MSQAIEASEGAVAPARVAEMLSYKELIEECLPADVESEEDGDDSSGDEDADEADTSRLRNLIRRKIRSKIIRDMIAEDWPDYCLSQRFSMPLDNRVKELAKQIIVAIETRYHEMLKRVYREVARGLADIEQAIKPHSEALTALLTEEAAKQEAIRAEASKKRKMEKLERQRKLLEEKERAIKEGRRPSSTTKPAKKRREESSSSSSSSGGSSSEEDSSYQNSESGDE